MPMKFLVVKHTIAEGFGIYEQLCWDAGITLDYVEPGKGDRFPDPQDYDALWVMGGAMNVEDSDRHPWILTELAFIRTAIETANLPYLGTCLGAQMLAAAMGGEVGRMTSPEMGMLPVTLNPQGQAHPLLQGLSPELSTFQWHGQEVKRLPDGATLLAASAQCPVQIYAVGDRAFGLQFHSEVTPTVMETWLTVPEYCADLDQTIGVTGREAFRQAVVEQAEEMSRDARCLFENFVAIAQT